MTRLADPRPYDTIGAVDLYANGPVDCEYDSSADGTQTPSPSARARLRAQFIAGGDLSGGDDLCALLVVTAPR